MCVHHGFQRLHRSTAYTRGESRRRHNTITEAADAGCLRAFPLVAIPLLHTVWGDLSGRVSSASCWKSRGIYKDEMITLVWEISAESLPWLYSWEKFLSTRLSATLWERRESWTLCLLILWNWWEKTERIYRAEERGVTGVYLHSSEIREHTSEWES